jgi:hypothetical protein
MSDETPWTPEDGASKQAELEAVATYASPDIEADLRELKNLQDAMRVDPRVKRRYESLRNQLTRQMKAEGARWFLDENGEKWLGYTVNPEEVVLDIDEATQMVAAGELPEQVLNLMAPRKKSVEGIRQVLGEKELSAQQVTRLLSFTPKTPYVKYVPPLGERDAGE